MRPRCRRAAPPKPLDNDCALRTYASVPLFTSANRLSNVREIVSVSTIVPDMNATPRITASAVSAKRSLWASSPLIVTRPTDYSPRLFARRSMIVSAVGFCELVDDLPVGEEDDAIGVPGGDRVVRDHHDRLAQVGDRLAHELQDLGARLRVEVPGRLVGEDDLRPARERARDGDPLLLTAGELRRAVVEPVGEPDGADHLVEPLLVGLLPGERQRAA